MIRLPRREGSMRPAPSLPSPAFPPSEAYSTVTTPGELVDVYGEALEDSRASWYHVAERASSIQDDTVNHSLETSVKDLAESWGNPMSAASIQNEARRIGAGLTVLGLLAARYLSLAPPPASQSAIDDQHTRARLFAIKNPDLSQLIQPPVTAKQGAAISEMRQIMTRADKVSVLILQALVRYSPQQPDGIFELADMYRNGIADDDPRFKEVREIVSTDWYHYDPAQSVLRSYCKNQEPGDHKAEFGQYVAEGKGNKRLRTIREMARFAVVAAKAQGLDLTLGEVISSTHEEWSSFPEVNSLFEAFIREKDARLAEAFEAIAGPKNPKSIRLPRPLKEIEDFKNSIYVGLGNRESRRDYRSNRKRLRASSTHLPDNKEIERVVQPEAERKTRKLMVAKNVAGIAHLQEIQLEEVIETFSISTGNGHLQEDITSMVDYLREEPISRASKILTDRTVTLKLPSGRTKKVPMRRFAPESSAARLKVHGDNRYYRVLFALADEALVLLNVLSHETYNKEFSKM